MPPGGTNMTETQHEIPSEDNRDPAAHRMKEEDLTQKKAGRAKKKLGLNGSGGSQKKKKKKRGGEGGSRTRYFMHAKQALYR